MNQAELRQQIAELVEASDMRRLRDTLVSIDPPDLADLLKDLNSDQKAVVFRILPREQATTTFEYIAPDEQLGLISALGDERFAKILNEMSADDRTALLEEFPAPAARALVNLLSKEERLVALKLLGYEPGSVGRLMNPDYIAVGQDWTVERVLNHIRTHGEDSDTLNVIYIVDQKGKLIDDLRIRKLLVATPEVKMSEIMDSQFVALNANDDQEIAVEKFRKYDRVALPVLDSQGIMLGIVKFDDAFDVAEEEATEDIQKLGAVEALDDPYMLTPLFQLVRKRAVWLVVLFVGEMFTATAMGLYEKEIQRAVVLALFIPLIISSGGNTGSQAATLIIRALAIGEITLKDWWKVMYREVLTGLALGLILGVIGFIRIAVWSSFGSLYGPQWASIGMVVGASLVGVVMWGAIAGAMLPFVLKKLGADPATSSAPFVATVVDVTGLVIYFSIASFLLRGNLL